MMRAGSKRTQCLVKWTNLTNPYEAGPRRTPSQLLMEPLLLFSVIGGSALSNPTIISF